MKQTDLTANTIKFSATNLVLTFTN